ncbi:hypothetical protein FB451DRAFT_1189018 [Mycena latifolia]|nr:hypothetical protein FB451DRAFT_1189018 [Mycena latifolia]
MVFFEPLHPYLGGALKEKSNRSPPASLLPSCFVQFTLSSHEPANGNRPPKKKKPRYREANQVGMASSGKRRMFRHDVHAPPGFEPKLDQSRISPRSKALRKLNCQIDGAFRLPFRLDYFSRTSAVLYQEQNRSCLVFGPNFPLSTFLSFWHLSGPAETQYPTPYEITDVPPDFVIALEYLKRTCRTALHESTILSQLEDENPRSLPPSKVGSNLVRIQTVYISVYKKLVIGRVVYWSKKIIPSLSGKFEGLRVDGKAFSRLNALPGFEPRPHHTCLD